MKQKTFFDYKKTPVVWDDVRRRLKEIDSAIEKGWSPSVEEKRKILKARAVKLAKEPEKKETAELLEIVEFTLAYEKYGIESSYVREVYPLKDLTPLPGVPAFVLGIINVRGEIVSVVDIKKFFDIPDKGIADLKKVIILQSSDMEFGILADAVTGERKIPVSELEPSLPTLSGIREEYLKGVTKDRVVVLDGKKLLSDKKIVVHEE